LLLAKSIDYPTLSRSGEYIHFFDIVEDGTPFYRVRVSDHKLERIGVVSLPRPTLRPLTSLAGNVASPAFSPDGMQVAFGWDGKTNGADWDLYVKKLGMSNDGKWLVFPQLDEKSSDLMNDRELEVTATSFDLLPARFSDGPSERLERARRLRSNTRPRSHRARTLTSLPPAFDAG
jgi:hypothetical protein